ncbi:MAG: 50S ribosomal protein L35 [SAR202 cluster bacterium]|nr:50S ribosomal protein L35 [Chloroflexota bacterium]MDP6421790.1 50S ribosomal protein L35 [SAR202 cluster bacterium]HAL47539.1 50S ribosomal protein L35 [Dehalococcoidia bacterium]MDP6664604.1 50S ribosomal protein L35 [SAR202 cluster bacterium]MDP6800914.1 50S ribosomal protein L35 [SAR202 cluster bacterium]
MPKLKTHKGAKRRFRITGTGKIVRMKGHKSHLRRKKPGNAKRLYSKKLPISPADVPQLKRALPYGLN